MASSVQQIDFRVGRVIFNRGSFFVLSATCLKSNREIKVAGKIPKSVEVKEGVILRAKGEYITDEKFGEQFKAKFFSTPEKDEAEKELRRKISDALSPVGVGKHAIYDLAREYGDKVLREPFIVSALAPYLLKPSQALDYAARSSTPSSEAEFYMALCSQVLHDIKRQSGDTIASESQMLDRFIGMFHGEEFPRDELESAFHAGLTLGVAEGLFEQISLDNEEIRFYAMKFHQEAEQDIASYIKHLAEQDVGAEENNQLIQNLRGLIKGRENEHLNVDVLSMQGPKPIILSPDQIYVVYAALGNKMSVITGGAGTGKTTISSAILEVAHHLSNELKVLCLAPTGKAARRITEATGWQATTIHSALGLLHNPEEQDASEKSEETQQKEDERRAAVSRSIKNADIIIIDESSMLDNRLVRLLFSRIPKKSRVLLFGDPYQLPPVGSGQPFFDLIQTNVIPVYTLREVFRQDDSSEYSLPKFAEMLKEGRLPDDLSPYPVDVVPLPSGDLRADPTLIDQVIEWGREMMKHLGLSGRFADAVQIVAPQKERGSGTQFWNIEIQKRLNPNPKDAFKHRFLHYKIGVGDKVINTRNDKDLGIMNGEVGWVERIERASGEPNNNRVNSMVIRFGKQLVRVPFKKLGSIELAYAITVHKAQGSECPLVILPIDREHQRNVERRLLYTAVTRAKERVLLVGDMSFLAEALANSGGIDRLTNLPHALSKLGMIPVDQADRLLKKKIASRVARPQIVPIPQQANSSHGLAQAENSQCVPADMDLSGLNMDLPLELGIFQGEYEQTLDSPETHPGISLREDNCASGDPESDPGLVFATPPALEISPDKVEDSRERPSVKRP